MIYMRSINGYRFMRAVLFVIISLGIGVPSALKSQSPELTVDKVLLNNISAPWGFTFMNANEVLFTEKRGKVFRYKISTDSLIEITGVPVVSQNGQGGLLDIALHPNFASNRWVYLTYAVSATGGQTTALGRGELIGSKLENFKEIFRALPIRNSGQHFGSRIVFDRDGFLFMSVGDRGTPENAQNRNNHLGKVLRFNDDGSVPKSNPLVDTPNTKPEIYCWGNRNIQGMAMNPNTGEIYAHEHGPRGGDELNLIKPNTNYGWPEVTFGINYDGTPITPDTTLPGMQLPLTYWVPSIAPSGMTFFKNGQLDNEFDVIIGALAGTHIHWLRMKDGKKTFGGRSLSGYARFRDVRQAPDGRVYAMTESPNRFVLLKTNIPLTSSNENLMRGVNQGDFKVYPNPGLDGFYVSAKTVDKQRVKIGIYDSRYVLMKEFVPEFHELQNGSFWVDLRDFPVGVYSVEIDNGVSKSCYRWVKL